MFPTLRSLSLALIFSLLASPWAFAAEDDAFRVSGDIKSIAAFPRSSGSKLETLDNPLNVGEQGENLFVSSNRARLKFDWEDKKKIFLKEATDSLKAHITYDHRLNAGSFVGGDDDLIARQIRERKQAIDLSGVLADEDGFMVEHVLYRAFIHMQTDYLDAVVGRQQVSWGVGRFKTPTDVFNPYDLTSLEPLERDGVDAVNLKKQLGDYKVNYVYTPRGRRLHPSRHMVRVSRDIHGYEVGVIGGSVAHDEVIGYDIEGNIKDAAIHSELLFHNAENEKSYTQAVVNLDYNFSNGIYALIEYYFNGQGKRREEDYRRDRLILGEIQELGRHYMGLELGYDITPLMRIENKVFMNLEDASVYDRVEWRYELRSDLILKLVGMLGLGDSGEEFGEFQNIYYGELQWFF